MDIIGQTIKAKATGKIGTITDISKKEITVSFEYGGKITIPVKSYQNILEMSEETKESIEAYLNQFNKPKKKKIGTKNIAIKALYCDGGIESNGIGYAGTCSRENLIYNIEKRKGSQCCDPEAECFRYYNGELTEEEFRKTFPCYECRMLTDWVAQAGIHKSEARKGQPMKFRDIAPQSICFLTTVFPQEEDRCIFGIFYINESDEGDFASAGYVKADPRYRVYFTTEEARELKFWNFYENQNNVDSTQWGTGLHRYLSDEQALQILDAAIKIKEKSGQANILKDLRELFVMTKGL